MHIEYERNSIFACYFQTGRNKRQVMNVKSLNMILFHKLSHRNLPCSVTRGNPVIQHIQLLCNHITDALVVEPDDSCFPVAILSRLVFLMST